MIEPDVELRGDTVVLVDALPEHVDELRRILHTPEVHARWGDDDTDPDWPFADPGTTVLTVLIDGVVGGLIQYWEETDPRYRYAAIDIFLDPAVHRRGLGRDAVRTLTRHLLRDRGHHRLTIDPAADNQVAIRCYAAVGFRPVGVMREYERNVGDEGWHDALFMEMLAGELT